MNHSYAIVLAGGAGTRLWPLSRANLPKQLLRIRDGKSLLQHSVLLLLKRVPAHRVYTLTSINCEHEVRQQLLEIHADLVKNVMVEPSIKNTLPAIAWATHVLHAKDSEASLGVFTSDQVFADEAAFLKAWESAEQSANKGCFTILGNEPTGPATQFGYIKRGPQKSGTQAYGVLEFKEKPSLEMAKKYIASGDYFWNAGIFMFKASDFVRELQKHQPQMAKLASQLASQQSLVADPKLYNQFQNISIDYGLVEKLSDIAVVPLSAGWQDVGNLQALYELNAKDSQQNVAHGDVFSLNSSGNFFWNDKGVLAAYGVKDMIVVQMEDATLVCPRALASEVKDLVNQVGSKHTTLLKTAASEQRPWGFFRVLVDTPGYKVKVISVKSGGSLSKQFHHQRSEHWTVVKGEATVEVGSKNLTLKINESVYIPKGETHCLSNKAGDLLEMIEVQVGEYLGEDDIVRIEDKYGRK